MKELRVYGPPGTGKTTYLSRQIERAADKFGGESVLVVSYTRTAAVGLVGRDLPVPERAVGTLHSHCYHALGRPKLADARVKEFNEQYPAWRFDPRGGSAEAVLEGMAQQTKGGELIQAYHRLRNQLVPRISWPSAVRDFGRVWDDLSERSPLVTVRLLGRLGACHRPEVTKKPRGVKPRP